MAQIYDAYPHGPLTKVFDDIYLVTGTSRANFAGSAWQFSRNMTILREDGALTLVNTVRLDDDGLAALDALGRVKNVVRLGAFHGMDDKFYIDRYGAQQWAFAGTEHEHGQTTDHVLRPGGKMPLADSSVFVFETSSKPEGLLILEREGGTVISCDALQNWCEVDAFFDPECGERMQKIGFIKPANIGPGWKQACTPEVSDYKRLAALEFSNLLPAHGAVIKGDARDQFATTLKEEIGDA